MTLLSVFGISSRQASVESAFGSVDFSSTTFGLSTICMMTELFGIENYPSRVLFLQKK